VIKARFQNLNKEVSGQTVEIYVNRVRLSLDDFAKWSTDRAQWERDSAAKGGARAANAEKKAPPKQKTAERNGEAEAASDDTRTVKFPTNAGGDVSVTFQREGLTIADIRRIAWGFDGVCLRFKLRIVGISFAVSDA